MSHIVDVTYEFLSSPRTFQRQSRNYKSLSTISKSTRPRHGDLIGTNSRMYSTQRRQRSSSSNETNEANETNDYVHDEQSSLSMKHFVSGTTHSKSNEEDINRITESMKSIGSTSTGDSWNCRICTYRNANTSALVCGACLLPMGSTPLFSENLNSNNELSSSNSEADSAKKKSTQYIDKKKEADQNVYDEAKSINEYRDIRYEEEKLPEDAKSVERNKFYFTNDVEEEKLPEDAESVERDKFCFTKDVDKVKLSEDYVESVEPYNLYYTNDDVKVVDEEENEESPNLSLRDPLEEQQCQLQKTDNQIEAIQAEMQRLEEKQMELIDRRMMLMTNITFLEQEHIDKMKSLRSSRKATTQMF